MNLQYIPTESKKKISIKKTQTKNYVQFGKIQLNVTLLPKHKLLAVYNSGGPIPGLLKKTTNVTQVFVDMMTILLQTKKIDIDLQKKLNAVESNAFEELMRWSRLKTVLNYSPHVLTTMDHIQRFDVLRGAVDAGLYAPEVIEELRHLTRLLSNPTVGRITSTDAIWILDLLDDLGST